MKNDPGKTGLGMSRAVAWWHTLLRATAVLNVALWSLAATAVTREQTSISVDIDAAYMQLLLSAVYVAGCAYRSFLPVIDIPRIVLVDSQLSSVLIGRSVATTIRRAVGSCAARVCISVAAWAA